MVMDHNLWSPGDIWGQDLKFLDYRGGGYKTGNMCGYKTNHSKKNCAGMTAIRPITAKGHFCGFDFYKTNHPKIDEIRPITPKSDWSYNHPLLY